MVRKLMLMLFVVIVASGAFSTALAQDVIELEAWVAFSDHRYDWAVDTAERFNALHDDINVNMVSVVDYDTIVNNYTLGREDGTYPEIVQLFDAALQFAVDSDWFSYAEEIIAGRDEVLGHPVDFEDIIPVISNYYTVDGVWASVAWNTSTPIMYYNVELLEQAGVMELPRTWADILDACVALQPLVDDGTISACATWPFSGWFIEQWLAQQNEYMVNNENGRAGRATEFNLDTDAYRAIAQFYRDLYSNGYFIFEGSGPVGAAHADLHFRQDCHHDEQFGRGPGDQRRRRRNRLHAGDDADGLQSGCAQRLGRQYPGWRDHVDQQWS